MGKKTILFVDDDPDIREALRDRLVNADYSVLTAKNGPEALQLIETAQIDGVLLDVRMPGMDGMKVLRQLRQKSQHIPVIIVTASVEKEKLQEAMQMGATDAVRKPIEYDELLSKIRAYI